MCLAHVAQGLRRVAQLRQRERAPEERLGARDRIWWHEIEREIERARAQRRRRAPVHHLQAHDGRVVQAGDPQRTSAVGELRVEQPCHRKQLGRTSLALEVLLQRHLLGKTGRRGERVHAALERWLQRLDEEGNQWPSRLD